MCDYLIVTFYSTHLALKFERVTKNNQLKTRLIPVPRQISSSCGLAGKVEKGDITAALELCHTHDIEYEQVYKKVNDQYEELHLS